MAIHDYVIANQNGANTRSDLNNAFSAIVSNNSSATEPTTTYAYQWWADTGNDLLKQRNAADSAWISILTLSTGAVSNAAIADDAVTLAKMAAGTDGELITYDTSGDPTTVPTGSSGEVLTSNGAGTTPTFQAAAAGKVLQVVTASTSSETTSTTATYADTGLTATITPTLATSTILVSVFQNGLRHYGGNTDINLYLQKDGVNWKYIGERISGFDVGTPAVNSVGGAGGQYLDSPADTSAHTYKTQFNNRLATGSVRVQDGGGVSTITLMEIGA